MFKNKMPNAHVPDVEDVSPNDLWERRNDVAVVDVRRPDEFTGDLGRVPGAVLLTLDQLPERLGELPRERPIVFVCRSGGRSAQAASFAKTHGYQDSYNMSGGMLRWNELGLETERGE